MTESAADYHKLTMEELNYNSYLQIPELLSLQKLQSKDDHPDELFFILIHQSFELWFKLCLSETDRMVGYLNACSVSRALKVLKRVNQVFETLSQQIQLLSTLTPAEFSAFRGSLGTGSGFQSVQFRELEFAFGLRDEWFLKFFKDDEFAMKRLRARLDSPSVYDAVLVAMATAGFKIPAQRRTDGPDPELVEIFKNLYQNAEENYHWVLLFEALIDFDMLVAKWRSIHVIMVSRTIGGRPGTGGSSGKAFLESRISHRFFPELWEVRNVFFDGVAYGEA